MIIYRPGERVTVKIGEVKIFITPLSVDEKFRVSQAAARGVDATKGTNIMPAVNETLRIAVKDIEAPGFQFSDGSPIKLDRKDDGTLSDEGLAVLLMVVDSGKMSNLAMQLAAFGVKDWDIEGVEIVHATPAEKKSTP